jgi:hypothetical protein
MFADREAELEALNDLWIHPGTRSIILCDRPQMKDERQSASSHLKQF